MILIRCRFKALGLMSSSKGACVKCWLHLFSLDMLGARLESEGDAALSNDACLCYISSGNVERLVECWVKNHETSSPLALQVQVLWCWFDSSLGLSGSPELSAFFHQSIWLPVDSGDLFVLTQVSPSSLGYEPTLKGGLHSESARVCVFTLHVNPAMDRRYSLLASLTYWCHLWASFWSGKFELYPFFYW